MYCSLIMTYSFSNVNRNRKGELTSHKIAGSKDATCYYTSEIIEAQLGLYFFSLPYFYLAGGIDQEIYGGIRRVDVEWLLMG